MFALSCSAVFAFALGAPVQFRTSPQQLPEGVAHGVLRSLREPHGPERRAGEDDPQAAELLRRSEEGFKRQLAQLGRQFAPPPAPEPARTDPLTYEELKQQALDRCRRSLAKTREVIKKIEEEPDPRVRESKAGVLKMFKEIEARELRQLEGLERSEEPRPWLPLARPLYIQPRTVRD